MWFVGAPARARRPLPGIGRSRALRSDPRPDRLCCVTRSTSGRFRATEGGIGDQWRALALRLTVLTLPAQVVGAFVGFLPTLLLGRRVLGVWWVPSLVLVGIGVVAGLAIGRLAHPPRHQIRAAVALAAVFGLVGFLILRLLVQLRLPEGTASPALPWVIGSLVVVLLQSLVVGAVWRRRSVRETDRV